MCVIFLASYKGILKSKQAARVVFTKVLCSYTQQKRHFFIIIVVVSKFKSVYLKSVLKKFLVSFISGNLMFSARNFTKSVWTPNKLFYTVCIDFMALLKYNRSLCKFSCSIRSDACRVLKT